MGEYVPVVVVGYISLKNVLRYHINHLERKNQNTQWVHPCWSCGQQGHFARTCPDVETSTKKLINKFNTKYEEVQGSYEEETIPYHVEITKPKLIGGHLYRPGSGVFKGKNEVGPKQAYLPSKPSKGTPRREQASDRRGAQRSDISTIR